MAAKRKKLFQHIERFAVVALAGCAAAVPVARAAQPAAAVPYHYQNVTFIAGGFITGFVSHPSVRGLYYVRTDIGGTYRWDDAARHWVPLLDWLPFSERNLLGTESIAVDPTDPAKLYIAAGTYVNDHTPDGAILRSSDQGRHFEAIHVPFKMGGNEDGRFAGERLQVDPNHPRTLLMGTRQKGLWRSDDSGVTWDQVTSFPPAPANNDGLTFVTFDKSSGMPGQPTPVIFVGVDDPVHGLMRSDDAGKSWKPAEGGPSRMFPNHGVLNGGTGAAGDLLYLSYGDVPGPNGMGNGAVWTYAPRSGKWQDVTPEKPGTGGQGFGYGMVTVDPEHPQTVLASTMDRWHPGDTIFRSTDGGQHWASLKEEASRDSSLAPWTKHTAAEAPFGHWLGAAMIDPFHPAHVLYGTGETIWESKDVGGPMGDLPAEADEMTHWAVGAPGLEETADITLLSPLLPGNAEPHLFTGLGDIGCFRNDDLARSPQGGAMKNPELSNCDSIALAADRPQEMVRVGRSWNPGPHGAISHDGGLTWKPFAAEPVGAERGGQAALSADGNVVVWALRVAAPNPAIVESGDEGAHWQAFPLQAEGGRGLQVVADPSRPESFWVFDPGAGALYRIDSATGTAHVMTKSAPKGTRLRIAAGDRTTLWLAGQAGLFRSGVPAGEDGMTFTAVPSVAAAYAVGFGKGGSESNPATPAIYLAGRLANGDETADALGGGLYRSLDGGSTWQRIDDAQHRFAWIEQITGDPRVFGRVYLGTNGRGVIEGEPQP